MERKQKTYQATNYIQLDTYVNVDGQARLVEFRGGSQDLNRNGIFTTSDPKVIAAMDADIARVGKDKASYKVIHEEVVLEDDPLTEELIEKEIPGVKTVTAAKAWLIDSSEQGLIAKGITAGMIKNRSDVLRIAAENKVVFTELPLE